MRSLRADRADARQRLDRVLLRHLADFPGLSRTRVQGWVGDGLVRINGRTAVRPAARLSSGDEIAVELPPSPPSRRCAAVAQPMDLAVLLEDEHLLAVDKPPGLTVHPTGGRQDGTLLNALLWRARAWPPGDRPCLVHRLDRWTSGVLLVAKRPEVHAALARAWRRKSSAKRYLALVYGRPPAPHGCIDLALRRVSGPSPGEARAREDATPAGGGFPAARPGGGPASRNGAGIGSKGGGERSRMIASRGEGLAALTVYEEVAASPEASLTLLCCTLHTGRMHQIRAHLQASGLPLVGDPVYGEPRWKGIAGPALRELCRGFPRQALHAWTLALAHPVTGVPLHIEAPLPADLAPLLAAAGCAAPRINYRETPRCPGSA